ncbi:MAG: filamentous hemagglutinin N-terminal domain-containing protein [Leptolyngbyaceae cyanobacterium]
MALLDRFKVFETSWLTTLLFLAIQGGFSAAQAQISPDTTLPVNSAVPDGCTLCTITGGTLSDDGQTLFHSFEQFSIPTGGAALFQNQPTLTTIFTRVTGGLPSDIDGAISAQGTVDLFLLNPNGIIFGPNASLALGGSFIASTADSIQFANNNSFSAVSPQAPPLLTVSTPVGLQFGSTPGEIINRSQAPSPLPPVPLPPLLFPPNTGLEVLAGQTLGLIGGNVSLEGGNLTAVQGQIQIGSVSNGTVTLTSMPTGLVFNYDDIQNFENIQLSNGARVTTSGLGGGNIQLHGDQIILTDSAQLSADNFGPLDGEGIQIQASRLQLETGARISAFTFGAGAGGDITVNATEALEFIGENSLDLIEAVLTGNFTLDLLENGLFAASVLGDGLGGDVRINTQTLSLTQGAVLATGSFFGDAQGGDLTIQAAESIQLDQSVLSSGTIGGGAAGQLTIETERITAQNGGLILSSNDGSGPGGDIDIMTSESIDLIGAVPLPTPSLPTGELPSGVVTTSRSSAPAGDIRLSTDRLAVRNGATISASTVGDSGVGGAISIDAAESVDVVGNSASGASGSAIFATTTGSGDAGSLTLNTGRLSLREGGRISTNANGPGMGGDVIVNASESVTIVGSATGRNSILVTESRNNGGGAGNLKIVTGQFTIQDGGRLSVNSTNRSVGGAGNLEVQAGSILLDGDGQITADNRVGSEGNITLSTDTVLLFRRGSQISTNSASESGGNISITAPFLITVPQENSDITANAQQGRGGRVSITAQSILGIAFRNTLTPESDITATSALGPEFNGIVVLITPELEPDSGLVELPTAVTDPANQIVAGCPADSNNSFTVSGQNGLPANPTQTLRTSGSWQDWRFLNNVPSVENTISPAEEMLAEQSTPLDEQPMYEANHVQTNKNGQIVLAATSAEISRLRAQPCVR